MKYLNQIGELVNSNEKQIIEKLNKILKEKQDMKNQLESLQNKLISNELKELYKSSTQKLDNIKTINV
jgi:alanyl-tRNA synthetase